MLKPLSNLSEQRLGDELIKESVRYGATVYRKVRVADVVDVDRLGDWQLGRFALMSHFDFGVADERHKPLFAVEFDGLDHIGVNDHKKDAIAQASGLALFRIKDREVVAGFRTSS
jgi:very-short-patch-repair endonuclease